MIPRGRPVADRAHIAMLHGLSWSKAKCDQPWTLPGHPKPLTPGPGRPGRPLLWDLDQAEAFALGKPVPRLPEGPHASDLLDRFEAAQAAGIAASHWEQDHYRSLVPAPFDDVHGMTVWTRQSVEAEKERRMTRRSGGGRPPGTTESIKRAEIRQRVAEVLDLATVHGEPEPAIAEVQRILGIAYTTASKHVHAIKAERAATAAVARDLTAQDRPEVDRQAS